MISRLDTPHGACVLVELAEREDVERALAQLPAEEQAHAATLAELRRREHAGGRFALHHAIGDFATPILADDRGAPRLPAGWVGSVSHKATLAAALVAPAAGAHVGLDLERAAPPKVDIARRILTPREQAALPVDAVERGRAMTRAFAIKEAIYKAVDPFVRRYVGFLEVEVDVDAGCIVTSELGLLIEASWCEHAGFWIATARASRD
ncbi:MAG TPA: 4'-phosphopantetheinyl transferase superfamily protein [Kofleriaceae bacterium]|nr:4'-phosphopantetheinyl transferase superfamily protein [Kofleriaceae bacterium]